MSAPACTSFTQPTAVTDSDRPSDHRVESRQCASSSVITSLSRTQWAGNESDSGPTSGIWYARDGRMHPLGYIDLFGIAVETGVVMIIFLDEASDLRLARGSVDHGDIEQATIEGAVHRLRPKLMTVFVVILSLAPIFFEAGSIGNDVMEPIAVPIVCGMITSSIAVLILLPVLFANIKERELRNGILRPSAVGAIEVSFDQRR